MNGALVTGAGQRIGRALAMALAADGWFVFVHHNRSATAARETVAAITAAGGKAKAEVAVGGATQAEAQLGAAKRAG
jgi:NAD(P)-dependent dehydrogenase (short-subunit alcohol dehydrogenase family)